MKRYIKSSLSPNKMSNLANTVHDLMYRVWYRSDETGVDTHTRQIADYIKARLANASYDSLSEYVYDHRHDIFDDYVLRKISTTAKDTHGIRITDAGRQFMLDYYEKLIPADYNRLLMLRRDDPFVRGVADLNRLPSPLRSKLIQLGIDI